MSTDFVFDSWSEFVDKAEFGESIMPMRARRSRIRGDWHDSWAGASWEEAVRLARHGWPEAVEMLDAKIEIVRNRIPTRREVVVNTYGMVGPGTIDMGRYIQGHPEPWITQQKELIEDYTVDQRVVPINFSISASSVISKEALFEKGALICILTDILEQEGKRVELTLHAGTSNRINVRVLIKRAEAPLDLDRIIFSIAHAACLRRLIFSVWEQAPSDDLNYCGIYPYWNYGMPTFENVPGALNIPPSCWGDYTEENQLQWLQDKLAPFGIFIKEEL